MLNRGISRNDRIRIHQSQAVGGARAGVEIHRLAEIAAKIVDGQVIEPTPSPRGMDSLECKVTQDEVLVKFETFYSGKTEKVVKA